MTRAAAACLVLLAITACNKRGNNDNAPETGTAHSADTVVTKSNSPSTEARISCALSSIESRNRSIDRGVKIG